MITVCILIAVLILYCITGFVACCVFLRRSSRHRHAGDTNSKSTAPKSFRIERDWLESAGCEDVFINADDGTQLHARFIQHQTSSRFIICCHGYRANSASTAGFAKLFFGLGFSVLMPDARAHGKSGGQYIGMGWPDRLDLLNWISFINSRYPGSDIALFGVSMGGATVMNTVGEHIPANVRCAIEDSGFVSIRKEMDYQLRQRHLPEALLYTAAPFCRLLAGFSPFQNTETVNALMRSGIPLLFIHGSDDRFVPLEHLYAAVKAHRGPDSTLIVPETGHADAIVTDPEAYRNSVSSFINTFIP